MKNRADEIKKRIEKRRQARNFNNSSKKQLNHSYLMQDGEKYGAPPHYDFDQDAPNKQHPLIKKEWFIVQVMFSICLFLVVGIMFKNDGAEWDKAQAFVNRTFETEFKFASVSNWYEDQFGKPLALIPVLNEENTPQIENNDTPVTTEPVYAVPVAGRVMETFAANGEGIMVETGVGSQVESIDEGFIVFVGVKEGLGKTVEVQHPDGSSTFYGNLNTINVKLYDFVKSRTALGEVTPTEGGKSGLFYFAIKKNDSFIDPIQVIPFE